MINLMPWYFSYIMKIAPQANQTLLKLCEENEIKKKNE
jgi:hypothetical protein